MKTEENRRTGFASLLAMAKIHLDNAQSAAEQDQAEKELRDLLYARAVARAHVVAPNERYGPINSAAFTAADAALMQAKEELSTYPHLSPGFLADLAIAALLGESSIDALPKNQGLLKRSLEEELEAWHEQVQEITYALEIAARKEESLYEEEDESHNDPLPAREPSPAELAERKNTYKAFIKLLYKAAALTTSRQKVDRATFEALAEYFQLQLDVAEKSSILPVSTKVFFLDKGLLRLRPTKALMSFLKEKTGKSRVTLEKRVSRTTKKLIEAEKQCGEYILGNLERVIRAQNILKKERRGRGFSASSVSLTEESTRRIQMNTQLSRLHRYPDALKDQDDCKSICSFLEEFDNPVDLYQAAATKHAHLGKCLECFDFLTELTLHYVKNGQIRPPDYSDVSLDEAFEESSSDAVMRESAQPSSQIDISKVKEIFSRAEEWARQRYGFSSFGIALLAFATGRFLAVTQTYCELLGYFEEELLDKTYHDITRFGSILASEKAHDFILHSSQDWTTNACYEVRKEYIRGDGSVMSARLIVARVPLPIGGIPCFVSIVHPIDRKVQIEDTREAEAECLKKLIDILDKLCVQQAELDIVLEQEVPMPYKAVLGS